jgi:hypothetical protein
MLRLGGSPGGGVGSYFVLRKLAALTGLDRWPRTIAGEKLLVGAVRGRRPGGDLSGGTANRRIDAEENRGPRFGREALNHLLRLCGESPSQHIERLVAGRRRGPLRFHVLHGGRQLQQRRRFRRGERLRGVRPRLSGRLLQPRGARVACGSRSLRNKDRVRLSMRCVPRHLQLQLRLRLRPEPIRPAPGPARRHDV